MIENLLHRYAKAIWFAVGLITLGGVLAALRLPVSLFPSVDYPRIAVSIDAGERDPNAMQASITRPLEIALRAVPGVTQIRSTTSRGSAEITLNFNWGDDMVAATLATEAALAQTQPDLPSDTRFTVRRSDPTLFPVIGLALTSSSEDPQSLRQYAELKLRPLLLTVPGVAGIDIQGGAAREVQIAIDPGRLASYGLGLGDVQQMLASSNVVRGVGRLEDRHRLFLVMVDNRFHALADVAAVPIKASASGVVTLGDVATITPSAEPQWVRITADGRNAVLVNIRQSLTGDTVAITREINKRLSLAHVPASIKVSTFYDQSELVVGAAQAVRDAILLGAILAGLVLFAFLRSIRLMVMTGLMLPAVLAATCLVLKAMGESFNMMTLGGLAAAVGLVVDDAVVMLEHIMRRIKEQNQLSPTALLAAAGEMSRPLVGSTLATVVVFTPLAFISGVSGGFFKALAVTMVAALLISLAYARLVIPLVAAGWLRTSDAEAAEKAGSMMHWLGQHYECFCRKILIRPVLVVAITASVLGCAGLIAYNHVESGFMPPMDEGGFIIDYKAHPGAALSDTDRILKQVEDIIRSTPEVASYSRRTGAQLGGGLTEADEGDFFVRLKGGSRRPIDEIMAEIRNKVEHQVPGIEVETAQLMEDLIGDLTAVPQPIEVKLFSDNPAQLTSTAKKIAAAISPINGVVEVVDGLRVAGDGISITIDRGAAAMQGLDPDMVANQLETQIGGTVPTQFQLGEQMIGVRLRGPDDARQRSGQIAAMSLRSNDGHLVTVGQIARVSVDPGQRQLTRENLAPFVAVTARLEGRDLGSGMKDVKATVARLHLPPSVRVEYGGLYAVQQASFVDLAGVLLAALLLSALLVTILFNNWRYTAGVMSTVLLSACAVLVGLWITGVELDISALMGLTMVVGMVAELAIFYLFELQDAKEHDIDVLTEAGLGRLRPIMMSALIAILTLAPLAIGISRGAGLQQPLATAIIFGLVVGAPLVLLFLPATLRLGAKEG